VSLVLSLCASVALRLFSSLSRSLVCGCALALASSLPPSAHFLVPCRWWLSSLRLVVWLFGHIGLVELCKASLSAL